MSDTSKSTMGDTRDFYPNREHGQSRAELTSQIREVNTEIRKRTNNNLTTEDQSWRRRNLRAARSSLN